ncbi:unnamed protein product, partial [Medioppia subpectinata]
MIVKLHNQHTYTLHSHWNLTVYLTLLLAAMVLAHDLPFRDCENRDYGKTFKFDIKSCNGTEFCQIKRGQPLDITIEFEPNQDDNNSTLTLGAVYFYHGEEQRVRLDTDLPNFDNNTCHHTNCPIRKDNKNTLTLKSTLPKDSLPNAKRIQLLTVIVDNPHEEPPDELIPLETKQDDSNSTIILVAVYDYHGEEVRVQVDPLLPEFDGNTCHHTDCPIRKDHKNSLELNSTLPVDLLPNAKRIQLLTTIVDINLDEILLEFLFHLQFLVILRLYGLLGVTLEKLLNLTSNHAMGAEFVNLNVVN